MIPRAHKPAVSPSEGKKRWMSSLKLTQGYPSSTFLFLVDCMILTDTSEDILLSLLIQMLAPSKTTIMDTPERMLHQLPGHHLACEVDSWN